MEWLGAQPTFICEELVCQEWVCAERWWCEEWVCDAPTPGATIRNWWRRLGRNATAAHRRC